MAALDIPADELAAAVEPLLARAGAELAGRILAIAQSVATDREQGLMDKAAAAKYLGIEVRALEDWMKAPHESPRGRGLPHFKLGETVRFSRVRIDAWALCHERNTPALLPALAA